MCFWLVRTNWVHTISLLILIRWERTKSEVLRSLLPPGRLDPCGPLAISSLSLSHSILHPMLSSFPIPNLFLAYVCRKTSRAGRKLGWGSTAQQAWVFLSNVCSRDFLWIEILTLKTRGAKETSKAQESRETHKIQKAQEARSAPRPHPLFIVSKKQFLKEGSCLQIVQGAPGMQVPWVISYIGVDFSGM